MGEVSSERTEGVSIPDWGEPCEWDKCVLWFSFMHLWINKKPCSKTTRLLYAWNSKASFLNGLGLHLFKEILNFCGSSGAEKSIHILYKHKKTFSRGNPSLWYFSINYKRALFPLQDCWCINHILTGSHHMGVK